MSGYDTDENTVPYTGQYADGIAYTELTVRHT